MKVKKLIIAVDIDGVLCNDLHDDYAKSKPMKESIKVINKLYEEGHYIMILSARGKLIGELEKAKKITIKQLKDWGVKYSEINWDLPHFDLGVNDKMNQSVHGLKKAFEKVGGMKFEDD
jgi:hypothetical protein